MGNHNLQRRTHEIISAKPDENLTAWITRGGKLPSYYWTMLDNLLTGNNWPTHIYSIKVKDLEALVKVAISDCACAAFPDGAADFHDALYFLGLKDNLYFDDGADVNWGI